MESNLQLEEKIANAIASSLLGHALATKDSTIQERIAYSFQILSEFKSSIRHFSENSYAKRAVRKAEEAWRTLAHETNVVNLTPTREQPFIDPETCELLNPEVHQRNPCAEPDTPFLGCFEDVYTLSNPSMLDNDTDIRNYIM